MKKIFFSLLLITPFLLQAQLVKTLKKTFNLTMPTKVYVSKNTGYDSLPGTRGAAVVWHPVQKKYYASFAGNYSYPMAVFDASGNRISDDDLTCLEDTRGLWYNPVSKKICGNGYSDIGWFSYTLDANGIPLDYQIDMEGMIQPGPQCIGVYDASAGNVCFLYGEKIFVYNKNGMQEEENTIRLYPGITKESDIDKDNDGSALSEDYSSNVLIYTGIPRAEFGILNAYSKQIELYNRKTGLLTQILKLPEDVPLWYAFNFGYANGIYWAFDQDSRIWNGYK